MKDWKREIRILGWEKRGNVVLLYRRRQRITFAGKRRFAKGKILAQPFISTIFYLQRPGNF